MGVFEAVIGIVTVGSNEGSREVNVLAGERSLVGGGVEREHQLQKCATKEGTEGSHQLWAK